jgi:hypothetical protein
VFVDFPKNSQRIDAAAVRRLAVLHERFVLARIEAKLAVRAGFLEPLLRHSVPPSALRYHTNVRSSSVSLVMICWVYLQAEAIEQSWK